MNSKYDSASTLLDANPGIFTEYTAQSTPCYRRLKPTLHPCDWDGLVNPVIGAMDCRYREGQRQPWIVEDPNGFTAEFCIDGEWFNVPNHPKIDITSQLRPVGSSDAMVFEHPSYGAGHLPTWDGLTVFSTIFDCREATRLTGRMKRAGTLLIRLHCFFSFGDIAGIMPRDMAEAIQRQCDQKRRIKTTNKWANPGRYYLELEPGQWYQVRFDIADVSARLGMGNLKSVASKAGIKMDSKASMDEYKSDMRVPYEDEKLRPEFLRYAARDCISQWIDHKTDEIVKIVYDKFEVTPPKETANKPGIAKTLGSTVEQFDRRYVEQKVFGMDGDEKENTLNPKHFLSPMEDPENEVYKLNWSLGLGSVRTLMEMYAQGTTAPFNCVVQGGRCKNEMSSVIKIDGTIVGDADIQGAYGNGLRYQLYPIGLPTILDFGYRQQKPNLGEFLDEWEGDLVPGCWQLIVDGDLDIFQTLIFSKPISDSKFVAQIKRRLDNEDPEMDIDFCLYTRQIKNGIITHDILQVLRAVCTDNEWSHLKKALIVKSGMAYLNQHRCETMEEMHETVKKKSGRIIVKRKRNGFRSVDDERNLAWYGFPLEEIVETLLNTRKEYKKTRDKHNEKSDEWFELNSDQEMYKLFVNTLYGVLASPFFPSGNVCVANNITARARSLAWMMACACGGVQSITDGSAYDMNAVRFWKGKRPGLESLSTFNLPHLRDDRGLHRSISTGPLGGAKWTFNRIDEGDIIINFGDEEIRGSAGKWGLVDRLYLEHLQSFFRDKDIDILFADGGIGQFGFEHKNLYSQLLTHSQSNYRLREFNGNEKIKARGHSLNKTHFGIDGEPLDEARIIELFNEIETGVITPKSPSFISVPLKVNDANSGKRLIEDNVLLAGDSIWKRTLITPISLSAFFWPDHATKKSWETIHEKFKTRLGWGLETYFWDAKTQTIDYQRAMLEIQQRIDEGMDWFESSGKLKSEKYWNSLPVNPKKDDLIRSEPSRISIIETY